jgi:hypothetical protein
MLLPEDLRGQEVRQGRAPPDIQGVKRLPLAAAGQGADKLAEETGAKADP